MSHKYSKLPPNQEMLRAKCFHSAGGFVEFSKSEIYQAISTRFEQQAAVYRDRIAVRSQNQSFSYGQLNSTANRIARAILAIRDAKPERVGLLLGHDAMMIAGIIGVLKAGKTCVPLEPQWPQFRIQQILEDAEIRLVLTSHEFLRGCNDLEDKTSVINLNELSLGLSDENVSLSIPPETLAYILYTSGSTGQPKGVTQTHRNGLHSAMGYINILHIQAEDRITLLGSSSGGQGMKIVISALMTGAALYPWNVSQDGVTNLGRWLVDNEITIYISGATVFRSFAATLDGSNQFPALRLVRVGNEPVRQTDVELFQRNFSPHTTFVNWFAVTETGNVACYFIEPARTVTEEIIPIGYACNDTEIMILADDGRKLGFDELGEIAVRSPYLSPGYWQQPDLTNAKFLGNDLEGESRTFLSGDMGFMRPDGCLYHSGRKDFQVKVSGNRIETGEIESALLNLYGIREAVVVSRKNAGSVHLVAYLVSADQSKISTAILRRELSQRLPEYMIPSAFLFLEAMPVTANGKVDRQRLPPIDDARPKLSTDYVAPRTSLEESLTNIWSQVIGVSGIGVHDNFFELGGNSVAAIQIASRVFKVFGLDVALQSLLQSTSIAQMADLLNEYRGKKLRKEDVGRILSELEALTDEDARRLVDNSDTKPRT